MTCKNGFFILTFFPFPGTETYASTSKILQSKARILETQSSVVNEKQVYEYKAIVLDGPYADKHIQGEFTPYENSQYDFQLRKSMVVQIQLYMYDGELCGDIVGVTVSII